MNWVALVELGLLGAGGGEGGGFAAEEGREKKGADDSDGVICNGGMISGVRENVLSGVKLTWSHPHHCTCVALT